MTILDGLAQLVAIPATVVCKIATKEAPFAGSSVDFASASWGDVMGAGLAPGPEHLRRGHP